MKTKHVLVLLGGFLILNLYALLYICICTYNHCNAYKILQYVFNIPYILYKNTFYQFFQTIVS